MAEGQKIDPNVWMVTFSDLIMLLLTFFVMLLTMSSLDRKKLKDIVIHLTEAPGVLDFADSRGLGDLSNFITTYSESEQTKFVVDQALLRELLIPSIETDQKMEELLDISDNESGIALSFQADLLFDSGEAKIKQEAFPVLHSMAKAIYSCPNEILIMGHADNVPVLSRLYESNWELTVQRGLSVLEYFLRVEGLSPLRFSVGGYGPSRPRYPNDTPRNRALNRRVEIIFKHL